MSSGGIACGQLLSQIVMADGTKVLSVIFVFTGAIMGLDHASLYHRLSRP